ncbi:MAG TPA: SAM-dependent methyltransferase [Candidatus Saccharimonadia bacterium]|nr:SAM-dependent methyltransferase [Candidatus Saccharimonadia bacterium]
MRVRSAVDQEIRDLIHKHGRITFAQFMQACLYSPRGGFYSSRGNRISTHFGTSPTSHPLFGALLARQLEQMWHLLGDPPVFHVLEVGAGDGALAQSIVHACWRMAPRLAQVLYYVAADYESRWLQSPDHTFDWDNGTGDGMSPSRRDAILGVQRVKTEGLRAFRNVVGCILCNELIDNFPVHRFAIQGGRVKEVFVTSAGGNLTEVLEEPSSPRIEERLTSLGLSLPEGYRGEVNLAMEDWTGQLSRALDRGFILTIDYGQLATDLYSLQNNQGTLVCYHRHVVSSDPYQYIGQQDITCQVDFTSLMRLGDRHGLATVGYALQRQFLTNLGFASFLDALQTQSLSAARTALSRMAMMTLVDPDEYGDFKVLAQAKGHGLGIDLLGFERQGT